MKGRPIGSRIRRRMASILGKIGFSYGYELYKIYKKQFGPVEVKSIYYNLSKGVELGEFILVKTENKVGDYSWGNESKVNWYGVGPFVVFSSSPIKLQMKKRDRDIDYDSVTRTLMKTVGSTNKLTRLEEWSKFNIGKETKQLLQNQKGLLSENL